MLLRATYATVRRVVVLVVGVTVVLIGVVMLVTPGPAVLVIPAGLALLATEFIWARRLLARVKDTIGEVSGAKRKAGARSGDDDDGPSRGADDTRSGRRDREG